MLEGNVLLFSVFALDIVFYTYSLGNGNSILITLVQQLNVSGVWYYTYSTIYVYGRLNLKNHGNQDYDYYYYYTDHRYLELEGKNGIELFNLLNYHLRERRIARLA